MKLHELHVEQLGASLVCQSMTVAGVLPTIAGDLKRAANPTRGEHDCFCTKNLKPAPLALISKRADDPKLKRYADNALAAAERGARLTGQLLAFSRVQRLEVRPTYVAPLIQNMRPLLRNVLGPGINKQFELDDAIMA